MNSVEVRGAVKIYGNKKKKINVLNNLNMTVKRGSMCVHKKIRLSSYF